MNHSDAPNTDFSSPAGGYALRDIAAGEELLCDYGEFAPEFELLPSLAAAHAAVEASNDGAAQADGAARLNGAAETGA